MAVARCVAGALFAALCSTAACVGGDGASAHGFLQREAPGSGAQPPVVQPGRWSEARAHAVALSQRLLGRQAPQYPQQTLTPEQERQLFIELLIWTLLFNAIMIGLAFVYFKHRVEPAVPENESSSFTADAFSKDFVVGLFDCFNNMEVCMLSCFCPAIRWAHTMQIMGFLSFWVAFAIFAGLSFLNTIISLGFGVGLCAILGTYYRQNMRKKFRMDNGTCTSVVFDFLAYCCCTSCAIAQEAQHVTEAIKAHAMPADEESS